MIKFYKIGVTTRTAQPRIQKGNGNILQRQVQCFRFCFNLIYFILFSSYISFCFSGLLKQGFYFIFIFIYFIIYIICIYLKLVFHREFPFPIQCNSFCENHISLFIWCSLYFICLLSVSYLSKSKKKKKSVND